MAITDYDRKKKLESSDFNDASSTIDKAQPIILAGNDYTGVDGFEGGTSQIGFASTGSVYFNGNGEVYGDDSLQFECSSLTSFTASESKSLQSSVSTDGKKVLFSLKFDTQTSDSDDELAFDLLNSSGNTVVTIEFRHDGTVHALNDTNFNQISSWSAGTIYDVEVVMDFTNFQFDVIINGTTEATDFGHAIDSSSVDQISIFHDTSTSGVSTNAFVDRLTYTNASEDSINAGGWIGYDSSIVADAQDFAWYDGNGNLIDYEIENGGNLGSASNKVTVWGYGSRTRDNSVQDQIAYGNNSANTDRQNVTGTWDNTGQAGPKVVHHLEENPNNGGSFDDSTSNNNDGTWNGNDNSNATGQFGDGQSLDGTDDNISFSSQSDVTTDDVTLVAWFKTPSSNNSPRAIFAYGDSSTANRVEFYPLGDGTFRVLVRSSGSNVVDLITSNSYDDDNWHQAVFTMDGTNEGTLYIDGSEPNLSSTTNSDNWTNDISGDDYWFIGAARVNNSDTDFYEGEIDEFRYYGTSWTANNPEKVQADYDASPAGGQVFFEQEMAESVKGGSVGFMREGRV